MNELIFQTLKKTDRKYYKDEYICRINKIIELIELHPNLAHDQEKLTRLCYFSPRHFHRIFKAFIGISLSDFAEKIVLENAAHLLIEQPQKNISLISEECGFENTSLFTKQFKAQFSESPTVWRKKTRSKHRRDKIQNDGQDDQTIIHDHNPKIHLPVYASIPKLNIWPKTSLSPLHNFCIEEFEPQNMVALQYNGSYEDINTSHQKIEVLCQLLDSANLFNNLNPEFLHIYHHNPDIIPPDQQTSSICLKAFSEELKHGGLEPLKLDGGTYAVGKFQLKTQDYAKAWNTLCGVWLPESGYQPDDRPCFELYPHNPCLNDSGPHPVKLCIPVKPL